MKLWLRLLWQLLSWRSRSPLEISGVGRRRFRVWPSDLDVFRHMNNGVFLTLLDLGRYDLGLRSGAWQAWKRLGWYPVVVAETITFRKSLTLWQIFDLETKVIGFDTEAFYFEQRFVVGEEIFARAYIRVRFLKRARGILTPDEVLDGTGWHGPRPKLPEHIGAWFATSNLPKGREPAPSNWDE